MSRYFCVYDINGIRWLQCCFYLPKCEIHMRYRTRRRNVYSIDLHNVKPPFKTLLVLTDKNTDSLQFGVSLRFNSSFFTYPWVYLQRYKTASAFLKYNTGSVRKCINTLRVWAIHPYTSIYLYTLHDCVNMYIHGYKWNYQII